MRIGISCPIVKHVKRSVQREVWGVESIRKPSVQDWDRRVEFFLYFFYSAAILYWTFFRFRSVKAKLVGKISRQTLTEQAICCNIQYAVIYIGAAGIPEPIYWHYSASYTSRQETANAQHQQRQFADFFSMIATPIYLY